MSGLMSATSEPTIVVPSIATAIDDGDAGAVERWSVDVPEAAERARQLALLSAVRLRGLDRKSVV